MLLWMLILLAVPLQGYDVMMVIGGRYYDHARQAYIELSTVEVGLFKDLLECNSKFQPPTPNTQQTAKIKEYQLTFKCDCISAGAVTPVSEWASQ